MKNNHSGDREKSFAGDAENSVLYEAVPEVIDILVFSVSSVVNLLTVL